MNKGWSSFMDRRVKERLIGATILVVLIVLIVPELLSGPRPSAKPSPAAGVTEPVRNVTVDLSTNKATPAADTPSAPAASAAPGDSASGDLDPGSKSEASAPSPGRHGAAPPTITTLQAQPPATSELENESTPPRSAPAAAKPNPPHEAPQPSGAHHGWAVQLGSFASSANAENLVHRLKSQHFSAYTTPSGAGKSLRYRVRVGPLADRGSADRMIARLKKDGHAASVVAP